MVTPDDLIKSKNSFLETLRIDGEIDIDENQGQEFESHFVTVDSDAELLDGGVFFGLSKVL